MHISGLAPGASNFLLDLLETGFNLPACPIILNDLFNTYMRGQW